jgi:hypothetical protein
VGADSQLSAQAWDIALLTVEPAIIDTRAAVRNEDIDETTSPIHFCDHGVWRLCFASSWEHASRQFIPFSASSER